MVTTVYTLTYTANEGGTITGTTSQTVKPASNGTLVTAVAKPGYHFVKWSDGSTTNPRTDTNVAATKAVTAEFALTTYALGTTSRLSGPSSVKKKKSLKLSGTVSPGGPGTVTITMTRKVGRKWKSAGHAHVNVVGGRYAYSPKPKYKGYWRFIASYSGGVSGVTTFKPSKSGTKSVKVK